MGVCDSSSNTKDIEGVDKDKENNTNENNKK